MFRNQFTKFDYFNISDTNDVWGLNITSAGFAEVPPNSIYPPTKHPNTYMFDWKFGRVLPEFVILYITKGEGIFETKTIKRKHINEGTIIFLFPNTWHRYTPIKEVGWKEYWVSFDGNQPRKMLEKGFLQPKSPVIEIGINDNIVQLYNQILEYIELQTIGYKEIIVSLTYQLIAQVNYIQKNKEFGYKGFESIISKTKIYMAENFDKKINFKSLALSFNVSYSWFRKVFCHYTHLAPTQYLLLLKLNKAKKLLSETTLSVGEISDSLGFESQFYFSKFFKKKTKISPLQWRKKYKIYQ